MQTMRFASGYGASRASPADLTDPAMIAQDVDGTMDCSKERGIGYCGPPRTIPRSIKGSEGPGDRQNTRLDADFVPVFPYS